MKDPVDHILRPPLPWRTAPGITECGFDASKVKTLTRVEFFSRLREMGRQRTALLTCMTCSDVAQRHGTWDDDPRAALQREIDWECRYRGDRHGAVLRDELLAIAALIESHRSEFETGLAEMRARREWNAKKAARTSQ